ncbi:MAG: hypothetical protein LBE92_09850 [Chryseobacterium sp.]|uniref:hypothetical protein n=1 Tax=Chryseobacterium sp. TaxID=1871047 RepID=UPI0028248CF9|nr:hypothetical protein [Chryseobacterium sp.]MDR2236417.1 hypothetical protein [Chryseobacterium sp.]
MKNRKKLTRKQLEFINGGDTSYALCDMDGQCPPTAGSYYCRDGICYVSNGNPGGGDGGSCHKPKRLCMPWETGCECSY